MLWLLLCLGFSPILLTVPAHTPLPDLQALENPGLRALASSLSVSLSDLIHLPDFNEPQVYTSSLDFSLDEGLTFPALKPLLY